MKFELENCQTQLSVSADPELVYNIGSAGAGVVVVLGAEAAASVVLHLGRAVRLQVGLKLLAPVLLYLGQRVRYFISAPALFCFNA